MAVQMTTAMTIKVTLRCQHQLSLRSPPLARVQGTWELWELRISSEDKNEKRN